MKFGICNCGKWGWAPAGYDERKLGLRCECGQAMFLHYSGHPKEAGYTDKAQITPTTFEHEGE